jgi:hypothetical protein
MKMADDSMMKDSGIVAVCALILTGIGYGLKWIGGKIWDLMLGQIKARIEEMDLRIKTLEDELKESKERECRFYDCPEGRPCAKIIRSFTMENAGRKQENEVRFLTPETRGDGSVVVKRQHR